MKTEGAIFVGIATFFTVIAAIYWFTSYEEAGSVLLLLAAGLGAIPGAWLIWGSRRTPPRLEDQEDADAAAGKGPVGTFPESSVWPFVFAIGLALAGVGFVFGVWFALPGLPLAVAGIVGAIAEGRRGVDPREQEAGGSDSF
ncbi:MAG TPA: cytochrome c oxidase subunit 4 [Acidimicrobiales bacterium]|nr:cytochrome c oxidase subunit 4 [Acidimicrobiales bacterium]